MKHARNCVKSPREEKSMNEDVQETYAWRREWENDPEEGRMRVPGTEAGRGGTKVPQTCWVGIFSKYLGIYSYFL